MGKSGESTAVCAGFSPRIEPRPPYPSLRFTLQMVAKEMFYQSAMLGVALTLALFPFYNGALALLRDQLGAHASDRMVFTVLANLVHLSAYVVINGSFGMCDYYGLLQEYTLARKPYMKLTKPLLTTALLQAALGQLVVNPLVLYYFYPSLVSFGMYPLDSSLPSIQNIFYTFCLAYMVNAVGFYWAHRTFHAKALYAYFHKQHHEFTGSMGIAAEYANPVEQILANLLPTLGGVIFRGTHPLIFCVWMFIRLAQTYEAHSGYCFKGTFFDKIGLSHWEGAAHHDYHHAVNTGNFGVEWMDWIFGTQDGFAQGGMHEGYIARKSTSKEI